METWPISRKARSRFCVVVAVSAVLSTLGGCATPPVMDGYQWIINQNEIGLRLVHGLPGTDVIDYTFLCERNRLHLWYSLGADDEAYGSSYNTDVEITIAKKKRVAHARAEFGEGGSPDIDATIDDPISMLREMAHSSQISTKDKWGERSARAPPSSAVRRFAARCAIPLK